MAWDLKNTIFKQKERWVIFWVAPFTSEKPGGNAVHKGVLSPLGKSWTKIIEMLNWIHHDSPWFTMIHLGFVQFFPKKWSVWFILDVRVAWQRQRFLACSDVTEGNDIIIKDVAHTGCIFISSLHGPSWSMSEKFWWKLKPKLGFIFQRNGGEVLVGFSFSRSKLNVSGPVVIFTQHSLQNMSKLRCCVSGLVSVSLQPFISNSKWPSFHQKLLMDNLEVSDIRNEMLHGSTWCVHFFWC